jgi:hypothetical protein
MSGVARGTIPPSGRSPLISRPRRAQPLDVAPCDLDLHSLQGLELVPGEEIALLVVVARQIGPEDLEAVADRDPGGHHEGTRR